MAGQNRSSYARSGGANRGLAAFFRGAFILLVALTLSFGLGFFVIARMVPANALDSTGGGSDGGAHSNPAAGTSQTERRVQHASSPQPSAQIAVKPGKPVATAQDGPVLLPDADVQNPAKVESNGADSTGSGETASDEPKTHNNRTNGESAANPADSTATGDESGDSAGTRRSRRRRAPSEESGAVQPAANPDAASSSANDSSRNPATEAPAVPKTGLYRVQIGVYSTREKAEEVARSASDKGIATTVHVVTRDGRTLYRVQHSSHRDRAKAETDRQKLIDAGFDASIINPQ